MTIAQVMRGGCGSAAEMRTQRTQHYGSRGAHQWPWVWWNSARLSGDTLHVDLLVCSLCTNSPTSWIVCWSFGVLVKCVCVQLVWSLGRWWCEKCEQKKKKLTGSIRFWIQIQRCVFSSLSSIHGASANLSIHMYCSDVFVVIWVLRCTVHVEVCQW